MKSQATVFVIAAVLYSVHAQGTCADETTPALIRTPATRIPGKCAHPPFPKEALLRNQSGKVSLAFRIGADGKVKDAKVVKSTGFPALDQAGLDAIRACPFIPATEDGKPVESASDVQYAWSLE